MSAGFLGGVVWCKVEWEGANGRLLGVVVVTRRDNGKGKE